MVARERPARAVGAMHTRRQTDDQQPGLAVAERRHGLAVVVRVAIVDLVEERREARARPTGAVEDAVSHSCAV